MIGWCKREEQSIPNPVLYSRVPDAHPVNSRLSLLIAEVSRDQIKINMTSIPLNIFKRLTRIKGSVVSILKTPLVINRRSQLLIAIFNGGRKRLPGFMSVSSVVAYGSLGLSFRASAAEIDSKEKAQVLKKSDGLFDSGKYLELLDYLVQQKSWYDDADYLWRVARCKYHLSKRTDIKSSEKNQLIQDAFVNIQRALELNPKSGPIHKWSAILLDSKSQLEGTKARIQETLNVRKHFEDAIQLDPKDTTSICLLGEWHYSVATTSWMERQIAGVIFAKVPEGDLETALKMFEMAESVDPGFYSRNLLMLAKTLIKLDREKERAKETLVRVVKNYHQSQKWDDVEAVTEAKSLLSKMGVTV